MFIFISIALAAFLVMAGSFLFGHDDDAGTDHGDVGHDVDSGDSEPTISIFSAKVIATLLMGFGAAGAIATYYRADYVVASLIGLAAGSLLAGLMYLILGVFYRQQASSLTPTNAAIGCSGTVTVSISEGAQGEIGLNLEGQYRTFSASAEDGKAIPKGQTVRVVKMLGSQLVVEREN